MKHVKIAIVAVAAALAIPAQADITQRDVLGVALGAFIGYQMAKPRAAQPHGHGHHQPGYTPPVPVYHGGHGHGHDHMPPTCVLRQVYSAPGNGPIYVQECHGGGRRHY